MPSHHFFSWVREAAVLAISEEDQQTGQLLPRASITVDVAAKNDAGVSKSGTTAMRLYGSGDVSSFDPRMVIRTDPPNLAHDFEPNYFAFVEFDRPDFPWLFTPAKASAKNRLTPWLCLVVVEKALVDLRFDAQKQLPPVLDVPPSELPDLTDAWSWAHAQVAYNETSSEQPSAVLRSDPARNCSRLICPRHLDEKKTYYACVVPTFNTGVLAGLGDKQVDNVTQLAFAWGPGSPQRLQLPVYYHWEFSTAERGDFEALVRKLKRLRLDDPRIGTRFVRVQAPGWPADVTLPIEGALRLPKSDPPEPTPLENLQANTDYQTFQQKLQQFLNDQSLPVDLPLPPTIYARWHAAVSSMPAANQRAWVNELNLNPSYRVAAALGVQVVRDQQEQLMAAAWEQAGEIRLANQKLRQAQFARTAATLLYRQHIASLNASTLLMLAAPVLTRVRDGASTLTKVVKQSAVPLSATQSAFRRLTSPRGLLARRVGMREQYWGARLIERINGEIVESGETLPQLQLDPPVRLPSLAATMEIVQPDSDIRFCEFTLLQIAERVSAQPPVGFDRPEIFLPLIANPEVLREQFNTLHELVTTLLEYIEPNDPNRALVRSALAKAKEAADRIAVDLDAGIFDRLLAWFLLLYFAVWIARMYVSDPELAGQIEVIWVQVQGLVPETSESKPFFDLVTAFLLHQEQLEGCEEEAGALPPLDVAHVQEVLLAALEPGATLTRRMQAQVKAPHWQPADALEPVMAAPKFLKPMYQPLAEQSHEYLLPGLEHVPPNSVALLETNTAFVEAYIVGLNHEMGRELLWRGYPTDQRGTYFYQFWDARTRVPKPDDPDSVRDIPPIVEATGVWSGALGSHMSGGVGGLIVLLLRGDLLRRYPRSVIYLAEAKPDGLEPSRDASKEKHPLFQAKLEPDVTLMIFDVAPDVARGNPGYFVILQQPPTEPRFGLDETAPAPAEASGTWRDLSWEHTSVVAGAFLTSSTPRHAPNNPQSPYQPATEAPKWDNEVTSAKLAAITLQTPFRIAIHASDLLPE